MTDFNELVIVLDAISATTKRKEKFSIIAEFLRSIRDDDVGIAALLLAGRTSAESDDRKLNMSWAGILNALQRAMQIDIKDIEKHYKGDAGEAVASVLESSAVPRQQGLFQERLTLESVQSTIEKISTKQGKGSKSEKEALLSKLFLIATPREIRYLVALFLGDMRTGVSDAMLIEGISEAYLIDADLLRRAWSFCGDIGKIAQIANKSGEKGIANVGIEIFVPIRPMLASPADRVEDALSEMGVECFLEMKYDGARVQIHKDGDEVRIFSRRLIEVTESLPEIASLILENVNPQKVILDGEVIAVIDGVPAPFQEVMKRFGRTQEIEQKMEEIQVQLFLFDIILKNDETYTDTDYKSRREILESLVPEELIAPRYAFESLDASETLFERSKELGHEGVMIKSASSGYVPGKRGKYWFKVKHSLSTFDMMVIAAEWGHGRRSNWLSDYHLGVLNEATGEFVMVGKTFKGLTDHELEVMTKRLQAIAYESKRGIVRVRPEIIVEIIASELQKSTTYESGIALRFARISRIREDLGPSDVTTLRELDETYNSQFEYKAR